MTYFLMMAILLNIMPGPAMFYVMHHSMQKNSRRTLLSLFGIECGTFMHTIAATLGLTVLLLKIPFFLIGAKYLCALFLIYLGVSALKKQTLKPANNFSLTSKDYFIFCKGVVINLLNPKVLLFFIAILPQCITIEASDAKYQIFVLGSLFCLFGILIRGIISIALMITLPKQRANPSEKISWLDKGMHSLFILFGVILLTWPK
ncbi:LysE family translocator [Legionella cincinnatiensis]|uniref:LysE type translocator n=1 Tax=Legionella cincinnatiensis TaxID=28085 RepID=A0A378INQ0_9GAMM|nr:LysE family translocator [Legionella cincinnatiensis]KTC92303.1 LysE type translocator [Legionella cincinnatiensis]STX36816.1 LysE type translocator [Legionella cincinnatiensis]